MKRKFFKSIESWDEADEITAQFLLVFGSLFILEVYIFIHTF